MSKITSVQHLFLKSITFIKTLPLHIYYPYTYFVIELLFFLEVGLAVEMTW
jgi:hypothetical protein